MIVGGKVTEGHAVLSAKVDVVKDDFIKTHGKIIKLQAQKVDMKDVGAPQECGIQFEGKALIEEGDTLIFYKEEITQKKI